MGEVMDDF